MVIFLYFIVGLFFLRSIVRFFKSFKKIIERDGYYVTEIMGGIIGLFFVLASEITIGIFALNYIKTF